MYTYVSPGVHQSLTSLARIACYTLLLNRDRIDFSTHECQFLPLAKADGRSARGLDVVHLEGTPTPLLPPVD